MRIVVVLLVVGGVATAILAMIGWPADRYRDNDYMGFWAGSRAVIEGLDPYDAATWVGLHLREGSRGLAIVPPATGFGYPLTAAIVFVPFALLPIGVAAPLWFVVQVTLAMLALALLGRQLFPATLRRDLPVLIALAATSQPAWVLAEGGNLGGFLLAIAAGSGALLLAGRPRAAGAIAGLAVMKPHPFLGAAPLLLAALPRRTALRLGLGALSVSAAVGVASLAIRPGWIAEWLVSLGRIQAAPVGRATAFGLFPPDLRALGWVLVLSAVVGFAAWARQPRPPALVIAAALPLSLFAAPYGWSYDHAILFVTVAVILALAAPLAPSARAKLLVLVALVTVPLPWALYALAFSRGEETWSAVVPIAVLAVLAIAARERPAHDRA